MRKKRSNIGSNKTEGLTGSGLTEYHPVIKWLIPGEKRNKLERICQKVKEFRQLPNVYLGCGRHSLPLDIVADLLEATSATK